MVNKILAIGDVGNIIKTIKKYSKKSEIHIINYPQDGSATFVNRNSDLFFKTWKVSEHVSKINEIKDDFDLCLTTGSERIAYLCDLNYIAYYLGRDIDVPKFKKHSKEEWQNEALFNNNLFERKFYWNAFKEAIAHVAGMWQYESLKKYTDDGINSARIPIDTDFFNPDIKPISIKKNKFTFFSPMRMEKAKGTDILWKALKLCKSDFDIIGVDWYGETTDEEREFKKELISNMPQQIKLIPPIKNEDMPKYYTFADAVIANLFIGTFELVSLESVMCGTPVIQFTDKKRKIIVDDNAVVSPFLPFSNEPETIAKLIDRMVESKSFCDEMLQQQQKFVNTISDPQKCADWWDSLFEKMIMNHKTIRKNSSKYKIKFRMFHFLISNRLYLSKIRKFLFHTNSYTGQTLYDNN